MNTQDKNQITEYLAGSRDYSEGVSLYQRFGQNLRLKRLFITDDTQTTKEILFEELRKLDRDLPNRSSPTFRAAQQPRNRPLTD